jgi:hypothetical protein
MPVTIDQLDIGIYIQYARRTELIEQVRQQYHLPEAGQVPAQALIVDLYPKLSEMDLLLGVATTHAPWAYFYAPKNYNSRRQSTFAFHRILPIFGSTEEDKDDEDGEKRLDSIVCETEEEEEEKSTIHRCIKQVKYLNELLRYIGGRIGQFLQG